MLYISLNESGNLNSALYKDCQELTEITIPEGKEIKLLKPHLKHVSILNLKIIVSAVNALHADVGIFVPSCDAYIRRKMKKQFSEAWTLSEDERLSMLQ